jgi:hypothetical protein
MRTIPLADQIDGINLRRSKGGASPNGLFDLVNAWVTPKGTVDIRPGTEIYAQAPASTKGMFGFQNSIHVFSHATVAVPAGVTLHVLRHPTGGVATLTRVNRAFAFLGRIYVSATFSDGVTQHYWLELLTSETWEADTVMRYGGYTQPTSPNGYYYEVTGFNGGAAMPDGWTPNTEQTIGNFVVPTTFNSFAYEVTDLDGPGPSFRTSNTEPTWPTVAGATVTERRYITEPQVDPGSSTPPSPVRDGRPISYGPYPPVGGDFENNLQED